MRKSQFISFRSDEDLFEWVKEYALNSDVSVSDVMRESLIRFRTSVLSGSNVELDRGIAALKAELGDTFRVIKTSSGVLLEGIPPVVM